MTPVGGNSIHGWADFPARELDAKSTEFGHMGTASCLIDRHGPEFTRQLPYGETSKLVGNFQLRLLRCGVDSRGRSQSQNDRKHDLPDAVGTLALNFTCCGVDEHLERLAIKAVSH